MEVTDTQAYYGDELHTAK